MFTSLKNNFHIIYMTCVLAFLLRGKGTVSENKYFQKLYVHQLSPSWKWVGALQAAIIRRYGISPSRTSFLLGERVYLTDDSHLLVWDLATQSREWFQVLESAGHPNLKISEGKNSRRIAILASFPSAIGLYTAIAVVLAGLGHKVHLLLTANGTSDGGPGNGWEKALVENELEEFMKLEFPEGLECVIFDNRMEEKDFPPGVGEVVKQQSRIDTCTGFQDSTVNIQSGAEKDFYEYKLANNTSFAKRFSHFVCHNEFDHWIIDCGSWSEYGVAFQILHESGESIICLGFPEERNKVLVSMNAPFPSMDTENAWAIMKRKRWSDDKQDAINDYAALLESPEYYRDRAHLKYHKKTKLSEMELKKRLEINNENPIILLMSNLAWDTTLLAERPHVAFRNHHQWLIETIEYFVDQPSMQLIIRPHPADGIRRSQDSCESQVRKNFPNLPGHVTLLPTDTDINTYGLMEASQLGLVYTSDVGWEMALRGKPVICGGRGHYSGKEITYDSTSSESYFSYLDRFSGDTTSLQVSEDRKERAMKYGYMFIKDRMKPFPWMPGLLWQDIKTYPMERVLTSPCYDQFHEAFELLSGDIKAYDGVVGWIDPSGLDS
jgi:hypothetical protein